MIVLLLLIRPSLGKPLITAFPQAKDKIQYQDWAILDGKTWIPAEQNQIYSCKESQIFSASKASQKIIGKFQIPPHSERIEIKFDVWMANLQYNGNPELDVYINSGKYESVLKIDQLIKCGDSHKWSRARVILDVYSSFQSIFFIVENNFMQRDSKEQLWGISDFSLNSDTCGEFQFVCSNGWNWNWDQAYRLYFQKELRSYEKIKQERYNFHIPPHLQKRIQFLLIINQPILTSFNLRVYFYNQEDDDLVLSFQPNQVSFQAVQIQFDLLSRQQEFAFQIQSIPHQNLGMRDLLMFIIPCEDGYCLKCEQKVEKNKQHCMECKPGYQLSQGQCFPVYDDGNLYQELIHESFINKDLLKSALESWSIVKRYQKSQNIQNLNQREYTSFTQNGLIIFGGHQIFNKETKIDFSTKINVKYYQEIHLMGQFYYRTKSKDFYPEIKISYNELSNHIICSFDDNDIIDKNNDIIDKNNDFIEMICDGEREYTINFSQQHFNFSLFLNAEQASSDDSWGVRNVRIHGYIRPQITCALIFTQINYEGESFEICGNINNFEHTQINSSIKSLKVPPGGKLKLYSKNQYLGQVYIFDKDTAIIEDDLSLRQAERQQDNLNEL